MSVQVLVIYIFLEISPCPLSFQMYWNKAVRVCYVLVSQLCLTLWDPMDCSLPGSSVHGLLQARVLKLSSQWLRLCTPNAEGPGSNPGQETRSHMLQLSICRLEQRSRMPQLRVCMPDEDQRSCVATKTWHS